MLGYYSKRQVKELFKEFINSNDSLVYRCTTWFMLGPARTNFRKYMEIDFNKYLDGFKRKN